MCCDLDLEDHIEIGTNSIERAGRSVFVNTDDRSEVIRRCIPKRGVKMAVIRTQGSFFRGLLTKRLSRPRASYGMSPNSRIELLAVFALEIFGE